MFAYGMYTNACECASEGYTENHMIINIMPTE